MNRNTIFVPIEAIEKWEDNLPKLAAWVVLQKNWQAAKPIMTVRKFMVLTSMTHSSAQRFLRAFVPYDPPGTWNG